VSDVPEPVPNEPQKRRKDFVDLTGQTFANWTVLTKLARKHYWQCKCVCGTERPVFGPDLKRGESTSCGCIPHVPTTEQIAKTNATKAITFARRRAKREKLEAAQKARDEAVKAEAEDAEKKKKEAAAAEERKKTKRNYKYGIDFGDEAWVNPLSIELHCYCFYKQRNTGHPREYHLRMAFSIVWPKFQWNKWCDMMIWAWCNYRIVCVIGHSRGSKTYFFSHLALLDYLCSPHNTATTMTTTKFDALKTRMWGDMMRAVESIENPALVNTIRHLFKITNTSNELKLSNAGASRGDDKFMIQGVATDSADKSAGKIRGQHADRRRILVDEAQDVASAIYMAFANATSAPDFVGVLLTNPVEKLSDFGNWCKPKDGWGSVHDTDLMWETETPGGVCLHLDGLQSPNITEGKTLFPFLLTQDYVDFIRNKFGEGSIEWWCFIRGFFPPDGTVSRVWPSATIEAALKANEFDFPPQGVASLDPAYEHDDCVLTLGLLGRLRDGRPCIRATSQHKILTVEGPGKPLKDRQIADQVKAMCIQGGVPPENYIQDTTGNGRSVYALLSEGWSPKIHKLEYGGSATDRPLRLNDPKPAEEQVKYFISELWFRASYLAADGMLCGLKNCDPKTIEDLHARRYTLKQDGDRKLMIAESKDEMKKRLGRSPDGGDSYMQMGELMVRKGLLGDVYIGGKGTGLSRWDACKKLAIKASSRWKREFVGHH
jgi:hypothetical protein